MTRLMNRTGLMIVAAMFLVSPFSACADLPKNSSTSDFSLPKMTDGEKDMLILGRKATNLGELVSIEGVRITLYPLKKRNSHIELFSPKASYNKALQRASSSERVNIRIFPKPTPESAPDKKAGNYNTIIDGVGFDLDSGEQTFRIRSKVNVRIFPSDTEAGKQSVTITSKELFYDVVKHHIEFKGDVNIVSTSPDPAQAFTLFSDSLSIYTDKHGDPSTMTATGNVMLTMEDDTATADKAIFRKMPSPAAGKWPNLGETIVHKEFQRFILSGSPIVEMGPQSMKGANKIIIDRCSGDQRVDTVGGKPEITLRKSAKIPALIPPLKGPMKHQPEGIPRDAP